MRKGFTLIELMVVIVIAALLSSIAIVYSSEGRNQVALSVEAAKESQLILQAKQLAIATYNQNPATPACGYGMYFDIPNSTYSLFIYSPASAQQPPYVCPSLASTTNFSVADMAPYSQESWQVPVAQGLRLESVSAGTGIGPSAVAVLFFPPDPQTLITNINDVNGAFSNVEAYVNIVTAGGGATTTIAITPAGQVSF